MFDNTLWAFVGLVLFLAMLVYLGVHRTAFGMLDKRAVAIRDELDQARRLREEAQGLLAEYQAKRTAAEREAADIVENAKAEAIRLTADAEVSIKDMIERRKKSVETKIAQAETAAIAEVRAVAAEVAIQAATRLLKDKVPGDVASGLVAKGIADVKARLN
jgi:F-type H+-transporting ATPase subunit b